MKKDLAHSYDFIDVFEEAFSMASVTFSPARLSGGALVPPAKSEAHRALLLAARTRIPFTGGGRAVYDEEKL